MFREFLGAMGMLAAIAVPAFSSNVSQLADKLSGNWSLTHINGTRVRNSNSRIGFTIDGTKINGFDGCNTFGGDLAHLDQLVGTQVGCPSDAVVLPLDWTNVSVFDSSTLTGQILVLRGKGGEKLTFKRH